MIEARRLSNCELIAILFVALQLNDSDLVLWRVQCGAVRDRRRGDQGVAQQQLRLQSNAAGQGSEYMNTAHHKRSKLISLTR
jgi:hypothetical protein